MGSGSRSNLTVVLTIAGVIALGIYVYWMFKVSNPSAEPRPPASADTEEKPDATKPSKGPGQVDDELIAHVQAGRYEEAYALTTRAYRDAVPLEDFARAMRNNRYLQTSKSIGCHRTVTYADRVHLRECILRAEVGWSYATLHYAIDEGEWRMTGIMIGGTPAFPGVASGDQPLPAEQP